jgi:hypothetical protein
MKILFLLLSVIFISGCEKPSLFDDYDYEYNKTRLANEITLKVAMQLKKEKSLHPCGIGGGAMDKIRMLYLAFDYYQETEIEEARKLIIDAVDLFLNTVSEDERVRPYLVQFPFQLENIEMRIFFTNPNGSKIETPQKIWVVAFADAELRYQINDLSKNILESNYIETYAEAKEKLNLMRELQN